MKKVAILGSVLMTLITTPSFEADAAAKYTKCNYKMIAGGSPYHAPQEFSRYHSGHVQCAQTAVTPYGYYGLTSQKHYN